MVLTCPRYAGQIDLPLPVLEDPEMRLLQDNTNLIIWMLVDPLAGRKRLFGEGVLLGLD